jgi:hypothetical protein
MSKGSIGGGVNISHKSKMSQSAKNQMGFSNGMPGPNVVGRGMAQYMAGEAVGMKKYGAHKGPEKALVGDQVNLNESLKKAIEAAPEKKSPKQMGEMEEAPMSTGPAKTRSEKRLERTKLKATQAKEDADKANDGSTSASSEKMNRTKAKADRLAKREKRQEGRAERKNIRKKAKEGKIIDGKSGEYNAMSKKEKIKASRKKQKAKDPVVKKESSSGKGGMMKAGDMKKVKKVNEMSNRRRKDTYSYQEPKAKVLKK